MKRFGVSAIALLCVGLMSSACRPDVADETSVIDSSYKPAAVGIMYSMSGTQLDALGKGGRITMQTLQGVVNRDSPSIFLANEIQKKRYKIFYYEPKNLSIINSKVVAKGYFITINYING